MERQFWKSTCKNHMGASQKVAPKAVQKWFGNAMVPANTVCFLDDFRVPGSGTRGSSAMSAVPMKRWTFPKELRRCREQCLRNAVAA